MTEQEFRKVKVGDIVECNEEDELFPEDFPRIGWKGKVIIKTSNYLSVEWKIEFEDGHDCGGFCKVGYGRNYFTDRENTHSIKAITSVHKDTQLNLFD